MAAVLGSHSTPNASAWQCRPSGGPEWQDQPHCDLGPHPGCEVRLRRRYGIGVPARLVLSGGIGSGKSTAAKIFATLGAVVFSADEFARRILAPGTEATEEVIKLWPGVADNGVINRLRLGRLVFADPARLAELEAITHPATRRSLGEAIDEVAEADIVVEMPIIRDWFKGWTVAVVDVADEIRVGRAVARKGQMSESEVRAVMERQPSRSDWLLAADLVVDNSGDEAALQETCREVWQRVTFV